MNIESGIPLPPRSSLQKGKPGHKKQAGKGKHQQLIGSMQTSQSVVVEDRKKALGMQMAARRQNKCVVCRKIADGKYRVWFMGGL